MNKYNHYIKALIYADPGTGKSFWANKAYNRFFISTDGNYSWLPNAKEEDHKQVFSWSEAKKIFAELNTPKYEKYDTIVIDLLEDLFKWNEAEFLKRNKLEDCSDMGYGKAYNITRSDFVVEMSKVIGLNKHIILLMHARTKVEKDRRGVETYKYMPSDRLPDKVLDQLEGRLRYCLRAYTKAEEGEGGKLIKKRYLSIIPKENEFGISRGLDESNCPEDIPLEWDVFCQTIGVELVEKDAEFESAKIKLPQETPDSVVLDTAKVTASVAKPTVQPRIITKPIAPEKVVTPAQAFVPQTEAIPTPLGNIVEAVSDAKPTASAPQAVTQAEKLAKLKAMLANRKK